MDDIQTYRGNTGHAAPAPYRPATAPLAVNPAAVKSASNYLRALRRRFWMVLAVAVPLASLACTYVLRMKPVYKVTAEIEINAPDYDPAMSALVSHDIGHRDAGGTSQYIPNRAAMLKSSRLHQKVVSSPALEAEVNQFEDPAAELLSSLAYMSPQRNGNTFIVTLEGNDPFRTKRLMEVLLEIFAQEAKDESSARMVASENLARENLETLKTNLNKLKLVIKDKLIKSTILGAGGKSLLEEQVVNLGTMLAQKQMRLGDLTQQMMMMEYFPRVDQSPAASRKDALLAQLNAEKRKYQEFLEYTRRTARNFNSDGAAQATARKLDGILDEIDEIKNMRTEVGMTPTEMILERVEKEIEADKEQHARLLAEMRAKIPEHQEVLDKIEESKQLAKRINEMEVGLDDFRMLARSPGITDLVKYPESIAEPSAPIKPNKPLLIAAALVLSLAAGIGLVCVLEHIDHAVKVPEHASHGLTMPLLGVVPRIRRTALTQRGSHLWTPGSSEALACDAYRNVRASLLGVADRRGPIVSLLVTSAKAGEGKSTTALNLAATCALAGERTLLLDVDLRRPSLADVFIEGEDPAPALGLVDVLKGDVPWQRTLRHTRIPNLDFMPTGDTRETPIEILGTLELRQLLSVLSRHYDRVILDGPAVLGLADCRFLGRIVDASMLVVRSGSHHLNTLHRAKSMLEQSHVAIAGVVFNGLTEDMENWSSYYGDYGALPSPARARATDDEALAVAGR